MADPAPQIDRAQIEKWRKIMLGLSSGEMDVDDVPESFLENLLKQRGISREQLRSDFGRRRKREEAAPNVGQPAPDFELELLSPGGKRTGEMRRLSDAFEKPVALIFGSYT